MADRVASLPMYDLPELRAAHDAFWSAIARRLVAAGVPDVPPALEREGSPEAHWSHPRLLLSQSCGYPLVTAFSGRLRVVATPRYAARGCTGASYASLLIVRAANPAADLEAMRGGVCAMNDPSSHSGMNVLRAMLAPFSRGRSFFREVRVTGGHLASIERVAAGDADLCAVDAVTHALLARHRPGALVGTRVLAMSPPAPALPYVTRADAPDDLVAELRVALDDAMADAGLAGAREALLLDGVTVLDPRAYEAITRIADSAGAHGYPDLV